MPKARRDKVVRDEWAVSQMALRACAKAFKPSFSF